MSELLRRILGLIGIGLSWSVVWAAFFFALASTIGFFRPEDLDSGETPIVFIGIGLVVGLVSGLAFGIIVSIVENSKGILKMGLARMAVWGALAAAVWPLLTPVDDRMTYILCPLGAVCAAVAVWGARRAELRGSQGIRPLGLVGRLVANPLKAACASNQ